MSSRSAGNGCRCNSPQSREVCRLLPGWIDAREPHSMHRLFGGVPRSAVVSLEPGVDGVLVEYRVADLELELVAEECLASAGVHHHARAEIHLPFAHLELDAWAGFRKVHASHTYTFVDGCAQLTCVVEQQIVELAAVHMIGVVLVDAGLFPLAEPDVRAAIRLEAVKVVRKAGGIIGGGGPCCAVLPWKLVAFHLLQETQLLEDAGRSGNQRFADVRSREQFAFQDDGIDACLCQVSSHAGPRRSAPDDRDVEVHFRRCCQWSFPPRVAVNSTNN